MGLHFYYTHKRTGRGIKRTAKKIAKTAVIAAVAAPLIYYGGPTAARYLGQVGWKGSKYLGKQALNASYAAAEPAILAAREAIKAAPAAALNATYNIAQPTILATRAAIRAAPSTIATAPARVARNVATSARFVPTYQKHLTYWTSRIPQNARYLPTPGEVVNAVPGSSFQQIARDAAAAAAAKTAYRKTWTHALTRTPRAILSAAKSFF
jgi:hypothetical protein